LHETHPVLTTLNISIIIIIIIITNPTTNLMCVPIWRWFRKGFCGGGGDRSIFRKEKKISSGLQKKNESGSKNLTPYDSERLIPVPARCKVWVCGYSLAGIAGSNPARGMNVCFL
jgi:hypothetical protein